MTQPSRPEFNTQACVPLPDLVRHTPCGCVLHARRRLGGTLIGAAALAALGSWSVAARAQQADPARANAAPESECQRSSFTQVVSADQVEQAAGQQYRQMLQQASQQNALASGDNAQLQRLRYIAKRIIPFTAGCNPRSAQWRWDVNLIGSKELNAFCMPGGKICFYNGILAQLQLDDDEVAIIMGHEMAHALLEHARARMGKTMATRGMIELGSALLGLGGAGRSLADMGGQLLTLRFSRDDESQADALGLVLAARAGYRPAAGVTLWQKMLSTHKGAPPQWLSTHPSGDSRIRDIQARLPRVDPMFDQACRPDRRFGPPTA
jgi:predicted Zn-dependent protease